MSITSWTSEGMDWSNPDPMQRKYWQALEFAWAERCAAIGMTPLTSSNYLTGFGMQYDPYPYTRMSRGYMLNSATILAEITHFVNYKKYGGTYTATKDFAPLWTTTEFLTEACSGGAYIPFEALFQQQLNSNLAKQYLIQCYRMLNLFRWRTGTCGKIKTYTRGANGSSWVIALANYNAAPVSSSVISIATKWDVVAFSQYSSVQENPCSNNIRYTPNDYAIIGEGKRVVVDFATGGYWILHDVFTKSCEMWASYLPVIEPFTGYVLDTTGCPYVLSTTGNTLLSTVTQVGTPLGVTPYVDFGDVNAACPPGGMPNPTSDGWGFALYFIMKWDGVGGFNFIAAV